MRLLQINNDDDLSLVEYFGNDIPPYAILSHTWGADDEEISFKDIKKNRARSKPSGYRKVRFCGEVARRNGIFFFWVDTCCIKQESSQEVGEAINSMYRWYHDAVICYVYLADVTVGTVTHECIASVSDWSPAFRSSRWFTRGWTLQELLAPVSIEFYSKDGYRLGDRTTLVQQIQLSTGIPEAALRGSPLSNFTVEERVSWARERITKREEDAAYSLLGLFGIHMPLIYGEGRRNALKRLQREIVRASREEPLSPMLSLSSVVLSSTTNSHPSGITTADESNPIGHPGISNESSRNSLHQAPTMSAALAAVQFIFRIDEARQQSILEAGELPRIIRMNGGITGRWWKCGSHVREIPEPPSSSAWRMFTTTSIYYNRGYNGAKGLFVAEGDALLLGPGEGQWNSLSFQHNEDYSSSLSLDGTHSTLRCQRRDSGWPEAMLPDIYHGPSTPYQQYGGLRGDLSIFLALMALSVKPDMLASLMPYLRHDARWQCHRNYSNGSGRLDNRGVVVYVYCGTEPGSTSEDLQAYEAGRYGNYFD